MCEEAVSSSLQEFVFVTMGMSYCAWFIAVYEGQDVLDMIILINNLLLFTMYIRSKFYYNW